MSASDVNIGSSKPAYRLGDTILVEEPWISLVDESYRPRVCSFCLKRQQSPLGGDALQAAFPRCQKCKYNHYCSSACQLADWPTHQLYCSALRRMIESKDRLFCANRRGNSIVLALFAMLRDRAELAADLSLPPSTTSATGGRRFRDLISHADKLPTMFDRRDGPRSPYAFQMMLFMLQTGLEKFAGITLPNVKEFVEILGRIMVNTMNIGDIWYEHIGYAVYLEASKFDHSCRPNAVPVFSGRNVRIVAIKQIERPEDVRVSYTELLEYRHERRKCLQEQYFFTCQCERCLDDDEERSMTSLRCPNPNCFQLLPGIITENTPKKLGTEKEEFSINIRNRISCTACNASYTAAKATELFNAIVEQSQSSREQVSNLWHAGEIDTLWKRLQTLRQQHCRFFHPKNLERFFIAYQGAKLVRFIGLEKEGIERAKEVARNVENYLPRYFPVQFQRKFEMARLIVELDQHQSIAQSLLSDVLEQTRVVFGDKHSFTIDCIEMYNVVSFRGGVAIIRAPSPAAISSVSKKSLRPHKNLHATKASRALTTTTSAVTANELLVANHENNNVPVKAEQKRKRQQNNDKIVIKEIVEGGEGSGEKRDTEKNSTNVVAVAESAANSSTGAEPTSNSTSDSDAVDLLQTFNINASNNTNTNGILCRFCSASVLSPDVAKYVRQPLPGIFLPGFVTKKRLDGGSESIPTENSSSTAQPSSGSSSGLNVADFSGGIYTHFWVVNDMFAFDNVGFSHAIAALTSVSGSIDSCETTSNSIIGDDALATQRRYLICAECEMGPIGYRDEHKQDKIYVACDRVKYE